MIFTRFSYRKDILGWGSKLVILWPTKLRELISFIQANQK